MSVFKVAHVVVFQRLFDTNYIRKFDQCGNFKTNFVSSQALNQTNSFGRIDSFEKLAETETK